MILISREQKGLASCQFYQMPLYLLPLLGPRISLGLENQFLSHSGIFSRPLEEKLKSRTKALPLLSQHPSLLQGIRTSGGGGSTEPTRCSSSPSIHWVQPRPSFSPFCTHWSLSPSQLTVVCQAKHPESQFWGSSSPHTRTGREGCFLTSIIQDALLAILV